MASVAQQASDDCTSRHNARARAPCPSPLGVTDDQPPPAVKSKESSIVAALRARLTVNDTQIAELRSAIRERDHTIAALHGELDQLHSTQR